MISSSEHNKFTLIYPNRQEFLNVWAVALKILSCALGTKPSYFVLARKKILVVSLLSLNANWFTVHSFGR
jgi:hypothetical protein